VERAIMVPYDPKFSRGEHISNLYFGASLPALCDLANSKGYDFVGSNSAGNNAYFVRSELHHGLKPLTAAEGYVISKFAESRDSKGRLTYLRGERAWLPSEDCRWSTLGRALRRSSEPDCQTRPASRSDTGTAVEHLAFLGVASCGVSNSSKVLLGGG
jgi:hypothetical protein